MSAHTCIACLWLWAVVLPGCASTETPTRGYALSVRVSEVATHKFAYYDLRTSGRLAYVAGMRANDTGELGDTNPTWSGNLSAEELTPLIEHLKANPNPAPAKVEEGKPNYRVIIQAPGGLLGTRFETGPSPFADRLDELLRAILRQKRKGEFDVRGP